MGKALRAINKGLDGVISGTGLLGIAIMLALSLFILMVIVARYIVAVNIPGFFDAAMYALIIFPFATAAYTLRQGRHIVVDILTERLPERTRAALDIAVYLTASAFVIVLGWKAGTWAYSLFSTGIMTEGIWAIPKGILVGLMLFGCLILILQIIRIIVKNIRSLASSGMPNRTSSPRLRDNPLLYVSIFVIGLGIGIVGFIYGNEVAALVFMLLLLLFSGMPVFLALGLLGGIGVFILIGSSALMQLPLVAYGHLDSFPLTCLPLFILGGLIIQQGKIANHLFEFFAMFTRRFPASLLVATIFVGGFFCAISGSSVATTAVIAAVAMPVLISRKFNKSLAAGAVGGSTIGTLIPPSLGYVVTGVICEISIAELFMAGLVPGAIIFALYFAYVIIRGIVSKKSLYEGGQVPEESLEQMSWKDRWLVTRKAVWGLLVPVIVLGGIYTGIFTPTEAAAVLVLYSIVVCVLIVRTIEWREIPKVTLRGAEISSMILCIIFSAFIFALVVSQLQMSAGLVNFAETTGMGSTGLLGLLFVLLLGLGLFMEAAAIKVITLPVFFPVSLAVGINPLWLGVFYQVMCEVALLTPPVGLNLFVIRGVSDIPLRTIIRGVWPFVVIMLVTLFICFFVPETITWLPGTMH